MGPQRGHTRRLDSHHLASTPSPPTKKGVAPDEPAPAGQPAPYTVRVFSCPHKEATLAIKPNPAWRGDPTFLPEVLRAFGVTVKEMPNWKLWGMGDFTSIWGIIVHHTGANNTSAEYIARNPGLDNGLSSQIHLDRKGVATLCGAGIAWHAGRGDYPGIQTNNANAVTIGIEAQGDGQTWPDEQLDAYYRICAAILWFLGLPVSRCIAHHEWAGRAQGKWDPGLNGKPMDMGVFRANVQKYLDNPPTEGAPVAGGTVLGGVSAAALNDAKVAAQSSDRKLNDVTAWLENIQKQVDQIGELVNVAVTQLVGGGRDKHGRPTISGWPQLGLTVDGKPLSLVDGIAAARADLARIEKSLKETK